MLVDVITKWQMEVCIYINVSRQKPNKHCEYCDQGGHTWKYAKKMQINVNKAEIFKEMDDTDDGPSDKLNSIVSQDPISVVRS